MKINKPYLLVLIVLFFGCNTNPSLGKIQDTLIHLNAARFSTSNYSSGAEMCVSTSFKGIGFTYYSNGSVQILTSNDSLAGIIKTQLNNLRIRFTDDQTDLYDNSVMHDIRCDEYFLPKL